MIDTAKKLDASPWNQTHNLGDLASPPTCGTVYRHPLPLTLGPTSGSTSPRRPVPQESAQPPVSKRRVQPQAAGTAQSRLVQTIALSTAEDGPLSKP